ncbi:SpoIIE family protein phosphatase [Streptomyces sp. ODS28]|uniref:SpoIIE family protein phosphatase n=1 Tax=Streptomyces sp. ODS28 TaxID=3136688 RepID=UPI0031ED2F82
MDDLHRHPPGRKPRLRSALRVRSIAGRVLVLQLLVVVLFVAVGLTALVIQAHRQSESKAREHALGVAQSFASAPGTVDAMTSADPTAELQPRSEQARRLADVGIITTYDTRGIRWSSSPHPELIGQHVVGPYKKAAHGKPFVQDFTGNLGRQVNAVVPVSDTRGKVVGIVSVGITVNEVNDVVQGQLPMLFVAAGAALLLGAGGAVLLGRRLRKETHGLGPTALSRMYEHHDAVLHAVREGVVVVGADGRLPLVNDEARRLLGLPLDAGYRRLSELPLPEAISELLTSGRVATDELHLVGGRLLTVNVRHTEPYGASGVVATLRDTTELRTLSDRAEGARERLTLLNDVGLRIGTSLEVPRTAEELAEATAPRFADVVTVDVADALLHGNEPEADALALRRTAVRGAAVGDLPERTGEPVAYAASSPQGRALDTAEAVVDPAVDSAAREGAGGAVAAAAPAGRLDAPGAPPGAHSLLAVPLRARGIVIGLVTFWRTDRADPFEPDDVALSVELVGHTAVCMDNARRYTREHATAVTLQRSLLPRTLPGQNAFDVAHRYLPAPSGVGGDFFDVLPLSGGRAALVVGDVVGHGLHAAATMGRLRTAVHNFSTLDLSPDELLAHLDELVARIDEEDQADKEAEGENDGADLGDGGREEREDAPPVTGATCLYAVYDPVTGVATLASAGHPGPALVHPDGTVELPRVPTSPPLGVGGQPFETTEMHLPEGTRLALYTDGLVEDRHRAHGTGSELLQRALADAADCEPEAMCRAVFDAVRPRDSQDDIALLIARTRTLGSEEVAEWDLPSDPTAVPQIRAACRDRLETWGLDHLTFTTELILSELATNAIRYGAEPIRVRMIRDNHLTVEVADGSSTSPHLRRAAVTEEGGRGLFLIAQYAQRWGTRYTPRGKAIWAEQSLHAPLPSPAADASDEDLLEQWADEGW